MIKNTRAGMIYSTLLVLLCCLGYSLAQRSVAQDAEFAKHSFKPPFQDFRGVGGVRKINDIWKTGGTAAVKENFVRLTPDQSNQHGWLMGNRPIDFEHFSVFLRFRISGVGKTMFGDGFGFWVTEKGNKPITKGPLLGAPDKFNGFGIMFDTFRNNDKNHIHKDISLVQSAGGSKVDLGKNRPSCTVKYRLHEGKDSFSVADHTAVKIEYARNIVTVKVDRLGSGSFKECFSVNLAENKDATEKLKPRWMKDKKVHFSFAAVTGSLSDNHDLLEFLVTQPRKLEGKLEENEELEQQSLVNLDSSADVSVDALVEEVISLANEVKLLMSKLSNLQHEFEHSMESVEGNLKGMINKVGTDEKAAEVRIAELERSTQKRVFDQLEKRVNEIERKTTIGIESRISAIERRLDTKVKKSIGESGAWRWPLFFFAVVVLIGFAWNAWSVTKINRRDKMF